MNAIRLRLLAASIFLFTADVALAGNLHGAVAALGALTTAQTVTLSVYSRMTGTGAIGRVELAPAVDREPPGAGPEDLPASAPTTPAIACATNSTASCVAQAATGSTVILQPVSVNNAAFVSWSGCTSIIPVGPGVPMPRCNVVMSGARTVTANFKVAAFALTARTYPALTPTYTPPYVGWLQAATDPPIDCQSGNPLYTACTGLAPNGSMTVVTAVPGPLAKVTSWTGCASSTATTCTVSMTGAKIVSATFGAANVVVTGQVQGTGTIAAALGGDVVDPMSCPGDCAASVTPGGSITLTATPGSGAQFSAWTGCASSTPVCTLTNVTAPATVTATFTASSCDSCHNVPPPPPHVTGLECGACHLGYTSTSVNVPVHMNGTLDVTCGGCHGYPPAAPHVQREDCGTCHLGYSAGLNTALHQNGVVDPQHRDIFGETCPGPETTPSCVTCHPCMNAR